MLTLFQVKDRAERIAYDAVDIFAVRAVFGLIGGLWN